MKNVYNILKKLYGLLLTVSFFGGLVPLIPYGFALIIGGATGEKIALFLYNDLYPWIIAFGSIAILVGLACTYLEKCIDKT